MVQIAIVEDDPNYTKQFSDYLEQYEREHGEKIRVTAYTDGDEITQGYQGNFDIILMDINMRFMNGMKAAEAIREKDTDVIIVFITDAPQYAIQGYKVQAFDYIVKPVSYTIFARTIERALDHRKKPDRRFLTVAVKGGKQKLDVSRIRYVEVFDHDLVYHTTEEDVEARGTMREVEEALSDEPFFKGNKGYLVNLEYVDGINGFDIQVGKDPLQVSRSRKKALIDAMNEYLGKTGR